MRGTKSNEGFGDGNLKGMKWIAARVRQAGYCQDRIACSL